MNQLEKQKLEVLNGDRGDKRQAAVRLVAAKALVDNVPVEPTGDMAADIAAVYSAINALRIALR
jgi:hypothetical protein